MTSTPDKGPGKLVGDSWASQQESLKSAPSGVDNHKKPGVMPATPSANQAIKHG